MIFVFDTETTGLPDFKARSIDPAQPHIVQLALLLLADDGTELQADSVLVRPDGWEITPELTAIHGISHERAMDEGVSEREAVARFMVWQALAGVRVAHNERFDLRILRIAMTRTGVKRDVIEFIEGRKSFCTCAAAKPVLKLPPSERMLAAGFPGPKPPRLEECVRHFWAEDLPGAHDALVDARACARVYLHLQSLAAAA